MVKVKLLQVFGAAAEATGVEEALRVLRDRWKEDSVVRTIMQEAAQRGYVLVDGRDFGPHHRAAFAKAIEKLRKRTQATAPSSSTTVKVAEIKEEGNRPSRGHKPLFYWESPEGVKVPVFPWDLTPKGDYWGFRDVRVEEAIRQVQDFLSKGELEESTTLLEEISELEDNPHFQRELLSHSEEDTLRAIGWDGQVRSLPSLVDSLATWEKKFIEGVRSIAALVDREKGRVVAVKRPDGWEVDTSYLKERGLSTAIVALSRIEMILAQAEAEEEAETWSTHRVRKHLEKVLPYLPERKARDISFRLEVVATLRKTAYRLDQMGQIVRRRAVVYRGPHGEEILRLPAYTIE